MKGLGITTDVVVAVVVPPGQTEAYALFTPPHDPETVYRVRLARDHYGVLRQSTEPVALPGFLENLHDALDDHFG